MESGFNVEINFSIYKHNLVLEESTFMHSNTSKIKFLIYIIYSFLSPFFFFLMNIKVQVPYVIQQVNEEHTHVNKRRVSIMGCSGKILSLSRIKSPPRLMC
jgi:hypothetical protein